jgi:hypothetical protein
LAEDALKSVPVFKGGYSEYVGWRMTARRFIQVGYYSKATAFSLLKKTLEGEAKRIVKNLSVKDRWTICCKPSTTSTATSISSLQNSVRKSRT